MSKARSARCAVTMLTAALLSSGCAAIDELGAITLSSDFCMSKETGQVCPYTPETGGSPPLSPWATADSGVQPPVGAGGSDGGAMVPDGGPGSGGTTNIGGCPKGAVHGGEVAILGDSFIEVPGTFSSDLEMLALRAGALKLDEHYRKYSTSGATMAGGLIGNQYEAAKATGRVKVVLMNGGGEDVLLLNPLCAIANPTLNMPACVGAVMTASNEARRLFAEMGKDGVEDIVFFFYPDLPVVIGDVDTFAVPIFKQVCDSQRQPRCHFVDLRPAFMGKTSLYIGLNGIHPTVAGAQAIADTVWGRMVLDCIAQ